MEWIALAWKYRNEIAIGLIILVLVSAGFYIKYVFQKRADLEIEVEKLKTDITKIEKQITLNKDIADAIKRIKIQSNNYVSVVETSTSPPVDSVSTLINSGVFLPSVHKAYSSASQPSDNEGSTVSP